jgi:hypothetical protein
MITPDMNIRTSDLLKQRHEPVSRRKQAPCQPRIDLVMI